MFSSGLPRENFILPSRAAYSNRDHAYPWIVRGNGPHLLDETGKTYFDAACGSGSLIFGHGDTQLATTLAEQSAKLSLFPSKMFGVEIVERYAKALKDYGPVGTARAICMSSGTDAVEAALKLAIQYHYEQGFPQRVKFIGRKAAYHGNSLAGLGVGGFWQRRAPYEDALWQYARAEAANEAVCHCGNDRSNGCSAAASVAAAIEAEGADTVAAVVIEPVVGAALSAMAPCDAYLAEVRAICDRFGILLVLDEVMTGFGRTGAAFASQLWGVRPDITICGKAISAGYYPLSAILVDERVAAVLEADGVPFQSGQTHAINPVGAAIGLDVLARLADGKLAAAGRETGAHILAELAAGVPEGTLARFRGRGMMLGFDVVVPENAPPAKPGTWSELFQECASEVGLIVYPSSGGPDGTEGEHAMMLPPLNLTSGHVDELISKVIAASDIYVERSVEA